MSRSHGCGRLSVRRPLVVVGRGLQQWLDPKKQLADNVCRMTTSIRDSNIASVADAANPPHYCAVAAGLLSIKDAAYLTVIPHEQRAVIRGDCESIIRGCVLCQKSQARGWAQPVRRCGFAFVRMGRTLCIFMLTRHLCRQHMIFPDTNRLMCACVVCCECAHHRGLQLQQAINRNLSRIPFPLPPSPFPLSW